MKEQHILEDNMKVHYGVNEITIALHDWKGNPPVVYFLSIKYLGIDQFILRLECIDANGKIVTLDATIINGCNINEVLDWFYVDGYNPITIGQYRVLFKKNENKVGIPEPTVTISKNNDTIATIRIIAHYNVWLRRISRILETIVATHLQNKLI